MALPVVKQCCCGCTLETGSKIIAWLQIVGGAFMLIAGIVVAVGGNSGTADHPSEGGTGLSVAQLSVGILSITFGVGLLMAIQKKRSDRINLWVIMNLVGIIAVIVGGIAFSIFLLVSGLIGVGIGVFIVCAIQIAFNFYVAVVVSSFRKEMVAAGNIGL